MDNLCDFMFLLHFRLFIELLINYKCIIYSQHSAFVMGYISMAISNANREISPIDCGHNSQ